MYAVAGELIQPFGNDLNDLDLDKLADDVAADVLFVGANSEHLTIASKDGDEYSDIDANQETVPNGQHHARSFSELSEIAESLRLAVNAVPIHQIILLALWTSACVIASMLLKRAPPSSLATKYLSALLSLNSPTKSYIGFALFLLLGFQLYDSHGCYMKGRRLWHSIVESTHLLSDHMFQIYSEGTWHKGDLKRIAAHLSGLAVTIAAKLRREDCREKLTSIMGLRDVEMIMRSPEKADHCLDVVRAYLLAGDDMRHKNHKACPSSAFEQRMMMMYVDRLRKEVSELERLVRVPIPFGYLQHSKVFLIIWLALLPLGMANEYGWKTLPLTLVVGYGLLGVERWTQELLDPFGYDLSDIPLDEYCVKVRESVECNLAAMRSGSQSMIVAGRVPPFSSQG